MMKQLKSKKTLLVGGTTVLAITILMAGLIFFNHSAQAAGGSPEPNNLSQTGAIPQNADQDADETPDSDADAGDGNADMRVNDTRMRWNGETWEYSTDGGKTWTDTPPDGVKVDENGGMTMWQGEGNIEDFDLDAYRQKVDDMINSIQSEIDERYGDVMPEGSEGGSFFTYGDSIARQVDGVWEFSSDGGETWTNEPPEGIEVSEDGTRFRFGGGEGDINDFNAEEWLEEWENEWRSNYEDEGSTTGTMQGTTI